MLKMRCPQTVLFISMCLPAALLACSKEAIHIESARLLPAGPLESALPENVVRDEGLGGNVRLVSVAIDGRNLQRLVRSGGEASFRYANCSDDGELDYSLGVFLNGAALRDLPRDDVREGNRYELLGTISVNTIQQATCVSVQLVTGSMISGTSGSNRVAMQIESR